VSFASKKSLNLESDDAALYETSYVEHRTNPVQELQGMLNSIGQDPKEFLNQFRQGLVGELNRAISEVNNTLGDAKRDILREMGVGGNSTNGTNGTNSTNSTEPEVDCMYWFMAGGEYSPYRYEQYIDWGHYNPGTVCAVYRGADGLEDWDTYTAEYTDWYGSHAFNLNE
jgi:hypothetical protein